nr:unnamed protein product [Callosobruchus analis]
MLMKLG